MSKKIRSGFTIIEISIAIAFLAIILITVAILTINILSIYRKGLSIKAVNANGRTLIDEFSRAISSSPAKSSEIACNKIISESARESCINDKAYRITYQQNTRSITINGKTKQIPTFGAFCTGRYSYIWNTGYTFNQFDPDINKSGISKASFSYKIKSKSGTQTLNNFRLLRVDDSDREVCLSHINGYTVSNSNHFSLTSRPLNNEPLELLSSAEEDLAFYDFKIFPPNQHELTRHSFYSGTFILATIRGGIDITSNGDFCKNPQDNSLQTDFAYCAINKFNFAMRATGELNEEEKEQQLRQ